MRAYSEESGTWGLADASNPDALGCPFCQKMFTGNMDAHVADNHPTIYREMKHPPLTLEQQALLTE
ncbi:MAG: hypothetical protein K0S38_880 [Candidatus Paceibacter sp.]|nr:hypothetical protein [Candidatus Paceibacter sp.]